MPAAAILGVEGTRLTGAERGFLAETQPWGFILFARNVETPEQLTALTGELRESVGRDAPILIDQEGGRVQRMRAPHWPEYLPALDQMARAADPLRAQWLRHRLIAHDLHSVGIDTDCAPLADLVEPETHPILRNRLYGGDIPTVVAAAQAAAEGLLAGGVLPVLKHIPGYGRANVDSHLEPARVTASAEALRARDFAPFRELRGMAIGMTAHAIYDAIDAGRPATLSPDVIALIREEIGFTGLLMTDDISMEALSGSLPERCANAIAAGCDLVLHSNGRMTEMEEVIAAAGAMGPEAEARGEAALAQRHAPEPADISGLRAELADLLG
ncbi:glycoside hydrolase family 3 protein [Pseudoroseicyclus tamaricis]|uniref:beta-N-acetylhexosaminidase n=1 Tax=Pseudoroseicyclus tamaricis TaxID=2705421 RepID=A0A6B2JTG2_9RHOB|nr:glycoside hydrolase family 3 protein [Pseudoroseicyclus tamaricis]NDV01558.1 glycoside hydrolase family 3 protein [Pseudoroseicyclus tamaricis]